MSFLHFTSRSLLASYFIADGVQAAVDPTPLVPEAEPLIEKTTELAEKYLPADLVRYVPSSAEAFIRLHGITQVTGALMMATGVFRRLGTIVLVVTYLPKVINWRDRRGDRMSFLREVALLGGLLIEAGDRQGKPNLTWLLTNQIQDHRTRKRSRTQKRVPVRNERLEQALSKVLKSST